MRGDFAVFILTYKRADKVVTYQQLRAGGYTGEIYLLCSSDDDTIREYKKKYKNVIVFNKDEVAGTFDIGDNFSGQGVVVFARNKNREIAKGLGLKYYLQLDDDYTSFEYKMPTGNKLIGAKAKNLDGVFENMIRLLEKTQALAVAFGQGGDYIGGKDNDFWENKGRQRKVMNSFFNSVDRDYKFTGRINEDVNCYTREGKTGGLFLSMPWFSITQKTTQANSGGLTEFYLDTGTYYKSFYSVMFSPSAIKVSLMGDTQLRLHHKINWRNAVPVIIKEKYKKAAKLG